ncbi:MAG TPA: N-acetylmuramoyl-L-alanine amidase-like domain-containing protein [Ignavibacteria bacterium]|nr:N-acetylmuramoyl-L-alanine amidase-like domain-containing protein [Ignavibacteria bacterium]
MDRRDFLKGAAMMSISGVFISRFGTSALKALPFDDYEDMKCKKILKSFDASLRDLPMDELIAEVGKSFIGTEYVGGTLDENVNESLVVKVTGLDCVTFVENTLIMARLIKKGKTEFEDYKKELEFIRYRNGKMDGYPSRLHYFSDWIYDNQEKGVLEDITAGIGGAPYIKTINFMTSNPNSYKQLKNDPANFQAMEEVEASLNSRQMHYIPKSEVDQFYDLLQTGDIIGTTTDIGGLDITHTGFVYKDGGGTYFMHASLPMKEVVISGEELKGYLMGNKKQSGIMVARPRAI